MPTVTEREKFPISTSIENAIAAAVSYRVSFAVYRATICGVWSSSTFFCSTIWTSSFWISSTFDLCSALRVFGDGLYSANPTSIAIGIETKTEPATSTDGGNEIWTANWSYSATIGMAISSENPLEKRSSCDIARTPYSIRC